MINKTKKYIIREYKKVNILENILENINIQLKI